MSLHYGTSSHATAIYTDWISHYPWEMAVHLTCRFPLSEFKLKQVLESAFHRRLARVAQRPVEGYYVIERGKLGQLHAHVLLLGIRHVDAKVVCRQWREGTAVVKLIYDLTGAVRYAMKDVDSVPDGRDFLGARAERHRLADTEPPARPMPLSPDTRLLGPNELPF